MEKKKICLAVYDISDMGGTNQVVASLCREFVKYCDVSVLSLRNTKDRVAHPLPQSVSLCVLLGADKPQRGTLFKSFFPALRYLRRQKFDGVFLIGHLVGFILSLVRPFTKSRFIFCDHGAIINQWDEKAERLMRVVGCRLSDKIVTLTERNREDYTRLLKVKPEKVCCIYNWVETDGINPAYSAEHKSIMWAGRFSQEKGVDMLYSVASEVLKKHPDWKWDVFGDGKMLGEYREKAEKDGLSEQLRMPGRCEHLSEEYDRHSLYVLTSYREGLPLVLLEAKAHALPIVSFDITTGPSEMVRDGVDGLLIEPKNTSLMAQKICELLENPDILCEMSCHARENLGKFQKEKILGEWLSLIETL